MPPAITTIAAVVGAGAAVVGTVQANKARNQQAKVQQEQIAEQRRQQQLQAQMQRRQSIRQAQLQRAQAMSFGQAAGGAGGSGIAGGLSSFASQFGAGSGYATQQSGINQNLSGLSAQYARFGNQVAQGQALAQLGGQVYGLAGGMDAIKAPFQQGSTAQ